MKNLSENVCHIYVRAFIYFINHYFTFVKITHIIIPTDQTTKIINI